MNKNNRKEQLYHEAFKLFLSKPFEAVSIADIESASGMTRGAITYYCQRQIGLVLFCGKTLFGRYAEFETENNSNRI